MAGIKLMELMVSGAITAGFLVLASLIIWGVQRFITRKDRKRDKVEQKLNDAVTDKELKEQCNRRHGALESRFATTVQQIRDEHAAQMISLRESMEAGFKNQETIVALRIDGVSDKVASVSGHVLGVDNRVATLQHELMNYMNGKGKEEG